MVCTHLSLAVSVSSDSLIGCGLTTTLVSLVAEAGEEDQAIASAAFEIEGLPAASGSSTLNMIRTMDHTEDHSLGS